MCIIRHIDNILQSKVASKKLLSFLGVLFGYVYCLKKEELPLAMVEVGFSLKERNILRTEAEEWNLNTSAFLSFERPQRNGIILIRKESGVIGDRAERTEYSLGLLVELVCISGLAYASHYHLTAQIMVGASIVIAFVVYVVLLETLVSPSISREIVAAGISLSHCCKKHCLLFLCREKLELDREFHIFIWKYNTNIRSFSNFPKLNYRYFLFNLTKGDAAFLCAAEDYAVSCGNFL